MLLSAREDNSRRRVHGFAKASAAARAVPVLRSDPRSGRVVQTILVAPRAVPSHAVARDAAVVMPAVWADEAADVVTPAPAGDSDVRELIEKTALAYNVNPDLVDSVVQVESNYNPLAVSPKGAQGLMQLMPGTARRFGVRNTFDPRENVEGGVRYLKFLQETFKDDLLAVAAYNAGERAVVRYNNNVPPYPETIHYVAKVGSRYGKARRASEAKKKAAVKQAVAAPAPPEEHHPPLRQFFDADGRVHLTTQ